MALSHGQRNDRSEASLGDIIRTHRDEIVREWEQAARKLPIANALDRPALLDHVPQLLARIAEIADALARGTTLRELAELHAIERLDEGFDLAQVVAEFSILRDSIVRAWAQSVLDPTRLAELRVLDQAFDKAAAAIHHHLLRERADQPVAELSTLADNIPQLAWIADATGAIYWYNQRWFDFTGTTLAESDGWGWQRVHHPAHLERVLQTFQHSLATGQPWEDLFPLRGRDGRYRWFLSRAVPIRDDRGQIVKWFGTNTDITERRFLSNATSMLATTLDVKETLAQVAQLAVPELADWCFVDVLEAEHLERIAAVHVDPAKLARVREWSRAIPAQQKPGISEVMSTGQPIYYPDITESVLAERFAAEPYRQMARELGVVSCIIVPLVARGRTLGTITLVHAESGRRYSRAELDAAVELGRRAGIAIDNARLYAEAQDAVHAREEILAIVSHDLRNPLNVIDLGATMALQSGDLGPKAHKHIETIHRSAARMERLLRDLLDTAALQVGRLALQRQPEEASALIAAALDGHEQLAAKKHIKIERTSDVEGVHVDCDRERITQAIGNLLGNAIKFCGPGDVVRVRSWSDERHLYLSVADAGPGITPAELPHIFEPYWSAKRHERKGTGLGLYICKGIVEAHEGTIAVDTRVGEGTTFTLTLPLLPTEVTHG